MPDFRLHKDSACNMQTPSLRYILHMHEGEKRGHKQAKSTYQELHARPEDSQNRHLWVSR